MKNKFALLAAATAAIAAPVAAQDSDDTIIVTATGAEQNIADSGVSISVIDEEEIRAQQSIAVVDLLRELPGISVTQSGGFGTLSSVRIRGAESDQTLVLINGVRVNDPSTPDGSFDFGNLLSGNIERIEVLRGANGVAWGSQAVGGVVHVTTKRPTDELSVGAQAEYGSRDTIRANANISGSLGPLGISVGGGYFDTDGISAFSGGTEADGYRQYTANGSLQLDIAENISVEANGYYADSRVDNDNVFPPFSSDNNQVSFAEEFYGNISLKANFLGGRFRNRFTFNISDINRDISGGFFTSRPRGRSERFEYQGDFAITGRVRTIFGAETENSSLENQGVTDSTGIDSIYLQLVLQPLTGFNLTGGARYDDHEDFGDEVSFAANLSYQISGGGPIIRASYSEGFRAPSLIDLDGRPTGFGTPELLPETARSYEIGIEQNFADGALIAAVTLFQRNTDNQIIFAACPTPPDPAPQVCIDGNRPFGTTLNLEETRARGVEVIMTLNPVNNFSLSGNFTYLDAKDRSAGANFGNELAQRPSQTLNLSADYQAPFGLKIGADLRIVGDSFDNIANTRPIDGHALVGLRAAMPVTKNIEFFGRVENLFDEQYEVATDFGTLGISGYAGIRGRF